MKRTTIFADDALLSEMKHLARQEKKSVAEVIREAMEEYVRSKQQPTKSLSFIGAGESGRSDISEKSEELLWQKSSH